MRFVIPLRSLTFRLRHVAFGLMALFVASLCGAYWYIERDIPEFSVMLKDLKQRSLDRGGYSGVEEIPTLFVCAFMSDSSNKNGLEYLLAAKMLSISMPQMRQSDWNFKGPILAWRIGRAMTRNEIMEAVLNAQYFGRGAYGPIAGAKAQFGVAANQLSLAQTAYLSGLAKSPATYEVNPEQGRRRRNHILDRMQASGCASEAETEKAKEEPLIVLPRRRSAQGASSMIQGAASPPAR